MKRAALYARVSTREQKETGTSLDSQLEAMRAWAQENGYEVACEFAEDWTGTQISRPKLDEAKRLAEAKEIDTLVVYCWDRLGRDMTHQFTLRYFFEEKWGIELISVTDPPMDELTATIHQTIMGLAGYIENYMRSERVTRGVRRAAKERGELPGGGQGLFGFDYRCKTKERPGARTINDQEARIARLIYRWFTEEGLSFRGIAQQLEDMGVRTKSGLGHWHPSAVKRILTNPAYKGQPMAFRYRMVEPKDPVEDERKKKRSSVRLRPEEEWIELKGPSIVSKEIWEAAQARMKQRTRERQKKTERRYDYLLTGMINCHCGAPMVGSTTQGKYAYYRCSRRIGTRSAHYFQVRAPEIEDKVTDYILRLLVGREVLGWLFHEDDFEDQKAKALKRIEEAEVALADLEKREDRLVHRASLVNFDQEKVEKQVLSIRKGREYWRREIRHAREDVEAQERLAGQQEELGDLLSALESGMLDVTRPRMREILEVVGTRVQMNEDSTFEVRDILSSVIDPLALRAVTPVSLASLRRRQGSPSGRTSCSSPGRSRSRGHAVALQWGLSLPYPRCDGQ